jgi:hypothetical protein
MNSPVRRGVEPPLCRSPLWCLLLCLAVHGCTEATGGAVELSWALRSTRDVGIDDCADDSIARIRLWWATDSTSRYTAFPCRDNHGVTAFDLPVGQVALHVAPECSDGNMADPADFVAPPPIVRDVAIGEAVTLDAVLLVLKIDDCASVMCVCGRPCICPQQAVGAPLATQPGTKHSDPAFRGDKP